MSKKNKRCPLQAECGRTCKHEGNELGCDYYKNNGFGDKSIPDQEEIRAKLELAQTTLLEEELIDEVDLEQKSLVYIDIGKLNPHPDNPRKELGDLTELAESIKNKGIMQNLTVVPYYSKVHKRVMKGLYTVIIGHRRCAAAKLAGLTQVPCVIVEMSPQEQVATMLLENIQRSDLTVYEQAQGFQMMLDLGEDVGSIAEKTGFSKSTVRRRLKIAELDQKVLQEVSGRQISLLDFERLEKIEDMKERNKVLKTIGTNNFEQSLSSALSAQKQKKQEELYRKVLAEYGAIEIPKKDKWDGKYRSHGGLNILIDEDGLRKTLDELKPKQIYFCIGDGYCYLRTPAGAEDPKEEAERLARQKEADERRARAQALDEAFARAYELRSGYIKKLAAGDGAFLTAPAIRFLLKYSCRYGGDFDEKKYCELIGMTDEAIELSDDLYTDIDRRMRSKPKLAIFVYAYAVVNDNKGITCRRWDNKYMENKYLEMIYEYLGTIGYEMSDEEKVLLDGTSELYLKEET